MTTMRSWSGLVAALGLAVSGLLIGTTAPGAVAAGTPTAYAAKVPTCTVMAINVRKGRHEAAAGSRFQTVRVTNEGDHSCSTPGWTRYRFFNLDGLLGFRSARNPGFDTDAAPVVIKAGQTVRSVLSWTDPGPVPAGQCHARTATGFRVHISQLPGFYRLPIHARVCTTKKYRPHGTRLSHRL